MILIIFFLLDTALCNPLLPVLDGTIGKAENKVLESRQFIGSSVIGGLMWPVLLTLGITAIFARVPDFLTGLITAEGLRSHRALRKKRTMEEDETFDEIVRTLQRAIDTLEDDDSDDDGEI